MMHCKRIYTYIFTLLLSNLLLCLCPQRASAQIKELFERKDSIPMLRGVSVSVDLFSAAQRLLSDYGQYEAALRVNLKDKYFPILELGIGDSKHDEDIVSGIEASTRAPYGRIGCDFNIMKNKHDDYRIYIGARYAYTAFDFNMSRADVVDPVWGGTAHYVVDGAKCYYHWLEAAFTVDAKIAGPVRLGWSVRYRRRIASDDGPAGEVWYVPGYGRAGKTTLGGTFNLIFEL